MTLLIENIYYADKNILNTIDTDFKLIDDKGWYKLYQYNANKSFWRLDKWDKYQEQFFVRLDTVENWTSFDDKELRIGLLHKTRGTSDKKCIWKDCNKPTLVELAYCERHAFEEMGIRR